MDCTDLIWLSLVIATSARGKPQAFVFPRFGKSMGAKQLHRNSRSAGSASFLNASISRHWVVRLPVLGKQDQWQLLSFARPW
jgi:hypothetical protein